MSPENMKKRYWKLSLMVHPDKCSHPQAHQAFVKLNKAFKDLQDPDKAAIKLKLKMPQHERRSFHHVRHLQLSNVKILGCKIEYFMQGSFVYFVVNYPNK
ncbi:dnaJ homolog subfamily C member 14-like [Sesamum indicum]|uniref:DnaJ homolog subfamily C member 14-like n=1 Tax=Sesamum indicum TaxID=4182 RepID=A0A8M8URY2_SESIN|nr:dnaJ homolog subfamily C member 14-like [Sesamum indicum]